MSGYVGLLRRNPSYFRLWIAQAVSLLGDWFSTIALSALVSRYTNGSGLAVSGLLLARFLPALIVGPFAGVLVDRLNRKRLLIFSDVLRAGIVFSFLFVTRPDLLWLIYLLTVLQFSLSALFEPGRSAMIPSVVRADDLVKANFLGNVTWSVMLAVGAAIGGLVSTVLGTSTALVIDASSFALSALLITSIAYIPKTAVHQPAEGKPSQRGLVDGLRYVRQHPATAAVLFIKMGGNIGSIDTLMVLYATQIFVIGENGAGSLGLLYAAFGLGAIMGPLLVNRFNNDTVRRMRRLVIVAYMLISVGLFLFSGAPSLLLAALALIIKAMGSSVYWTYSSVILQKTVPDAFLGRVFSLDLAGFQLAVVISVVITGALVQSVGTPGTRAIAFGTAAVSVIPLVLWILAIPWIERQDTHTQQS